jgi:hypothetical protein
MAQTDQSTFDFLTGSEGEFMQELFGKFSEAPWAKPIIEEINANGGLVSKNKAKLFELRFGCCLQEAGVQPHYEVPGEGASTLDFGFRASGQDFLVELMRLEETAAARAATTVREFDDGAVLVERSLSSAAEDERQSEEGETLKAVERICQKFEHNGRSHKFPPCGSATHILLVDFRTFLNGGDEWDRIHVGLGGEYVQNEFRRYYKDRLISGVFSSRTPVRGASQARERLHFIGFVNEKVYNLTAFGSAIQFIANPNLFKTPEEAHRALAGWPLGKPDVLNARNKVSLVKLVEMLSTLTVDEVVRLAEMLRRRWKLGQDK